MSGSDAGKVGFFVVILSGGLLFTEVNVEIPATILSRRAVDIRHLVLRLWVVAALGNLAGGFLVGQLPLLSQAPTGAR